MDGPLAEGLNGLLLRANGSHEIWLILLGTRHHVVSLEVYNSLFNPEAEVIEVESVSHIRRGFDICDGSILVKSLNSGKIYLVSHGDTGKIKKYYISSFETFNDFGFDMDKVREFPDILVDAICEGQEISSY